MATSNLHRIGGDGALQQVDSTRRDLPDATSADSWRAHISLDITHQHVQETWDSLGTGIWPRRAPHGGAEAGARIVVVVS